MGAVLHLLQLEGRYTGERRLQAGLVVPVDDPWLFEREYFREPME